MKDTFLKLLNDWCDGLLRYQVTYLEDRGVEGGIICPSCSLMHGRSYVAVHPLLYMARHSGDEGYIKAAEGLIKWSKHMLCEDGSFVNDSMAEWKGITAFSAIALTDSLYKYGDLLKSSTQKQLDELISGSLEYLYNDFDLSITAPINYLSGTAYALELGGKYRDNGKYRARAKEYMEYMLEFISENGLLYGESLHGSRNWGRTSQKGCHSIDIGYNVEETINFMVLYALSAKDSKILNKAIEIAKAHADFFIPDGGWDNSFGVRMDKWTYWGSRTTDGCQPTYTILSRYDDRFAYIAWKNAEYLSKCTYDGLLYGGRDLYICGEPACIHHTFTHAVGLATALEWMDDQDAPKVKSYNPQFRKYYGELDTYLYSSKTWRATITGYDMKIENKPSSHPTGGALSLLYHQDAGVILSSSLTVYRRFEIVNTQRNRYIEDNPLTMRMQVIEEGITYSNILDNRAVIQQVDDNTYLVRGNIVDVNGNTSVDEDANFEIKYIFEEDRVRIILVNEIEADIYIPIIISKGDTVEGLSIKRDKYSICLSSNAKITGGRKIFNLVPGFQAAEFKVEKSDRKTELTIDIN